MDERTQVLIATLLGAVVGGVVGTLYFTERGRDVRDQLEPLLDNIIAELQRTQQTVDKAREVTTEGRRTLDDLLKKPSGPTSWEERDRRQVSF